jgi:transcriptional regulator with XRE-family HTH domain
VSRYRPEYRALIAILRQLRTEAGLTQAELAVRLGQRQTYVSKYELGERRLDILELRDICESLGASLVDVVRRFENGD